MKQIYLFCLLALPAIILTFDTNARPLAWAEEDELEDEVVDVEGSGEGVEGEGERSVLGGDGVVGDGPSPQADITILFTKPSLPAQPDGQLELPAGRVVELLVGVTNWGEEELLLEWLDASFRYPMDFTFHIQNFTQAWYGRALPPRQQATLAYSFLPAEPFAGRPFGLSLNLHYRDASGNSFSEAVYNQTVNVTEVGGGLDGETFFLYVFLGAGLVLALVGGQAALAQLQRRHASRPPPQRLETGTARKDVDYDWLPRELLTQINKKSPKATKQSPKQSPRQKKTKSD